jgi:hypothetical protein
MITSNAVSRQDAKGRGLSYRRFRSWEGADKAYFNAYNADQISVTPDNVSFPLIRQPYPLSARDWDAMFWEWVDIHGLPTEYDDSDD